MSPTKEEVERIKKVFKANNHLTSTWDWFAKPSLQLADCPDVFEISAKAVVTPLNIPVYRYDFRVGRDPNGRYFEIICRGVIVARGGLPGGKNF
jgi:hypothetical protein